MKKLTLLLLAGITLISCKNEPKDYATFSGKITNHLGKNGSIQTRGYKKDITINADGTFKDTLHIKNVGQLFQFTDGNEYTSLFLKNGDDVHITLDTKEFDETIKYTGVGAESNNYLAQKSLLQEKLFTPDIFGLEEDAFKEKIKEIAVKLNEFTNNATNIDDSLLVKEKEGNAKFAEEILAYYKSMKMQKEKDAKLTGKPSPTFDYENHKGGKTSLADLKGKYVYVDVWATWCGPCRAEIPSLKKVEKQYHGKNIAFVSISIDVAKDHDKWKKFVTEKQLGGIQLFADKDWKSDFVTGYGINGIPRFILIDPQGNIVSPDAPRPSNPKLIDLFNKLKI